jgi:inosine-uridine nucleoside N-ribohydrolase
MQRDSYAFVKPETPTIPNPAEADHLLDAIAEVVMSAVRKVTAAQTGPSTGTRSFLRSIPE